MCGLVSVVPIEIRYIFWRYWRTLVGGRGMEDRRALGIWAGCVALFMPNYRGHGDTERREEGQRGVGYAEGGRRVI